MTAIAKLGSLLWAPLSRVLIALWISAGAMTIYAQHYATPKPNPATGQLYPIWEHGSQLYVTRLQIWVYDGLAIGSGICFVTILAAVFVAKSREM